MKMRYAGGEALQDDVLGFTETELGSQFRFNNSRLRNPAGTPI